MSALDASSCGAMDPTSFRSDASPNFNFNNMQYDDERNRQRSLQAVAPRDDEQRNVLEATLRTARQLLPPTAEPEIVQAPQYLANPNGTVPFGNPRVLNSAIAMGALVHNNMTNAQQPYRLLLPNLPALPPPPPNPPLHKHFRTRKYCVICGWRKKEHTKDEGKGGKDKAGNKNCKRGYCGNCYRMKSVHVTEGFEMGPQCPLPTNRYCTVNVNDWWEYKVRY
jgi:hypothetical protein